jgi:subtilase family serine protease
LSHMSPGTHPVYLVVDPDRTVSESDELNNTLTYTLLISAERVMLPLVAR